MSKIVAALIVKNEEAVIRRCCASIAPHVRHIVVNDNGSTDNTLGAIEYLDPIVVPGEWVDFSVNRNLVLNVAKQWGDYVLCGIDADEELVVPDGYVWPELTADGYNLVCHYNDLRYKRVALVKSSHPWTWRGVIHEVLVSDIGGHVATLDGPYIRVGTGGARSLDPETQARDLAVLHAAVTAEPNNPRYRFYLAQTMKDCGEFAAARSQYETRAMIPGYPPETSYAQYMVGCMDERLGTNPIPAYMQAFNCDPTRAEPLVAAARYLRLNGNPMMAAVLARSATQMHTPTHGFFVESDAYSWRALDEFVSTAYYVPHLRAAGAIAAGVLAGSPDVPESDRERVAQNCAFYKDL